MGKELPDILKENTECFQMIILAEAARRGKDMDAHAKFLLMANFRLALSTISAEDFDVKIPAEVWEAIEDLMLKAAAACRMAKEEAIKNNIHLEE